MNCAACYSRSAFICVYCSILFSATALATENGQQSYPIGSNTVLSGIIPDRGKTQFYNYSAYYHADKFAGNHGERGSRLQGRRSGRCVACGPYLGHFKRPV